jgi:hydroxyethylthiazole kinase-like uncharacterized protein yjeF
MSVSLIDIFPDHDQAAIRQFFDTAATGYSFVDSEMISQYILPRKPDAYKGNFGHLLLIAGSEGKTGAAILSARAALRTGCGLLTAAVPVAAQAPLLTVLPEAMTIIRSNAEPLPLLDRYNAVGFGPGIGFDTGPMLHELLLQQTRPMVIDADGITVLSQNQDWYELLTPSVILTPHAGEFDRLTQKHESQFARCQTQLAFSRRYGVHVLLKGRYTSISTPDGFLYFNTTGNSGMATAGSGDVLTGIIASLLAQGYESAAAAVLGAYLHGYAGDTMAEQLSKTSLVASDIIEGIPAFFRRFER